MFLSDITFVLQWWILLFFIGIGFLPVTFFLFPRFFDRGYAFSKIVGIGIFSYIVFALGVFHIIPFTTFFSFLILLSSVVIVFLITPNKKNYFSIMKQHWLVFLFEEVLFFAALLFWSYIHSFAADIHGLEKYMDFGFINSALRGTSLPPRDMWLTPYSINYYYFGHFITALLTRLSNVPSYISFNIMMATIFAFCLSQTFSLGANMFYFLQGERISKYKLFVPGLLTACLVTFAGNLHILYAFFTPYKTDNPVPLWKLTLSPFTFPNSYWYPNATRFIYNTIHEFPIYSWVVADLHGHVLDIPFVILIIALLFSVIVNFSVSESKKIGNSKTNFLLNLSFIRFLMHPFFFFFIAFLLSIMYMTNAWDGIIYFLLCSLVILVLEWLLFINSKLTIFQRCTTVFIESLSSIFILGTAFIIFSFPFSLHFNPFVSGIGVLCAPDFLTRIGHIGPFLFEANHCQKSPWWQLLILYGFFYFFVISFFIFLKKTKKLLLTDIFVIILIALSTLLIIIPEFIYAKDIYPAHYRANTMFKLVFQSFIMLSISSGYSIVRLLSREPHEKFINFLLSFKRSFFYLIFLVITLILLLLVFIYPFLAVNSYYGDLKNYYGLNGINYLKNLYPNDYEAILWLNKYIKGQPVILEAQGDSYTDYARVSANTGLPTILGWTVHEWLWRGEYDYPANDTRRNDKNFLYYYPAPRIAEVESLYTSSDINETKRLIKKYHISYVFIGNLEYQKYPTLNENKFKQLGKVVFQSGQTKIYKTLNP